MISVMITKREKTKIPGLKRNMKYADAAPIILGKKLNDVINLINLYLENDSTENLHELRIAIRRFRYTMELFFNCYRSKKIKNAYKYAKLLQDLLGEGRDLDVLGPNVQKIAVELNAEFPAHLFHKINSDRKETRQKIKLELIKFMDDKNVNKFIIKKVKK